MAQTTDKGSALSLASLTSAVSSSVSELHAAPLECEPDQPGGFLLTLVLERASLLGLSGCWGGTAPQKLLVPQACRARPCPPLRPQPRTEGRLLTGLWLLGLDPGPSTDPSSSPPPPALRACGRGDAARAGALPASGEGPELGSVSSPPQNGQEGEMKWLAVLLFSQIGVLASGPVSWGGLKRIPSSAARGAAKSRTGFGESG